MIEPVAGDLCWTPWEPHKLFRVTCIDPPVRWHGASAFGFFESADIAGLARGQIGRYPLKELRKADESYLTEA